MRAILSLAESELCNFAKDGNPDMLRKFVAEKTKGFTINEINEVCNVLTKKVVIANEQN